MAEFKKDFLNHLSLYFVNLLANGNESKSTNSSNLSVKGVRHGKITENPIMYKRSYQDSKFMADIESNIHSLFEQVRNIRLPEQNEVVDVSESEKDEKIVALGVNNSLANFGKANKECQDQLKGFNSIFGSVEITLQKELQNEIKSFAEESNIELNYNDFFNIGELSKQKQPFGGGPFGTGSSYSLVGSEDEKEKYRLLDQLYEKISEYRQWKSYFESLDSKFYIDLCLSNFGTSYDEDVDIKLYVKTGQLCIGKQLPLPDNDILETAINFTEPFFKPKKSLSVIEYDDYPEYVSVSPPDIHLYGLTRSYEEKVESYKEEYLESIDDIFCYDYFQEDGFDVICYKQSYIKQNTNIYFPSIIVFQNILSTIHFEISSKYLPEVIKRGIKPYFRKIIYIDSNR